MSLVDVGAVADDLYALAPGDFTATRAARAAEARRAGDRDLAAAITRLRRPTTGAWIVNLLVRRRPDELSELLHLGQEMREVQAQLAGDELRRLSRQRHQVVSALLRRARLLAEDLGQTVSAATEREVEATLEAALADAGAADAVRSGCLTTALSYSGLGPVDLHGVVAVEAVAPPTAAAAGPAGEILLPAAEGKGATQRTEEAPPQSRVAAEEGRPQSRVTSEGALRQSRPTAEEELRPRRDAADEERRQRRAAAEEELRRAREALEVARTRLAARAHRAEEATVEHERRRRRTREVESQLEASRDEEGRAARAERQAAEDRDGAERALRAALDTAGAAAAEVERLGPAPGAG